MRILSKGYRYWKKNFLGKKKSKQFRPKWVGLREKSAGTKKAAD